MTALTMLKIAEFAPMPTANVKIAMVAKAGFLLPGASQIICSWKEAKQAVLATVVAGEIVVDVVLVELVGDTEVLVDAAIVVVGAPVVVVVLSVVVVVVVEGEQADINDTEVDAAAWKPSGHVACSDNMTSPVNPPGTMVVAEVWPLLATSE